MLLHKCNFKLLSLDIIGICGDIAEFANNQGAKFSGFLFGLIIGLLVAYVLMWNTLRLQTNSAKSVLEEKKADIVELKRLVYDKMHNIRVEQKDKTWFTRLKKYFYKNAKNKEDS